MSQEGAQPGTGLPPGQVATLTVVRGPDTGRTVELNGARTVVGRRQGELVLSDREVSGVHAAIEATGGEFLVKDLGSTNGTFVDGEKVSSRPLASGSHLKCGATYLLFQVAAVAEPEEAPLVEAELLDDGAPLVAAEAAEADEGEQDLGLGAPPEGIDEGWELPSDAPGAPPAAAEPEPEPVAELEHPSKPATPVGLPEPPRAAPLPDEVPTGIAPPSSVPASAIPPAAAAQSAAAVAQPPEAGQPIPPAGPPVVPPPAAPESAPEAPPAEPEPSPDPPTPEPEPPPRVGVTSHGSKREDEPVGTPWDALSLPEGSSSPIAPSLGGSPHVATPLPGDIQLPTPEPASPPALPESPDAAPAAAPALPAGVESSPHDLYLVVEAGADEGQVFPISKDLTVLGRSDLDLQIHDADVSRKHVVLELKGRGPHLLRDLGSTNGTLLNGMKVTENLISPNDIIRMGVTRLKLVSGAAALRAELERIAQG